MRPRTSAYHSHFKMASTSLRSPTARAKKRQSTSVRTRVSRAADAAQKRRSPAQKRSRVTVNAIVEAAGQLLVELGSAAVTTNAVAARAGVSIGSLYQYFPNKEALFSALQERHRHEVFPLIEHAFARFCDPSVDLVEGIVTLLRGFVDLHRGNPDHLKALADELPEHLTTEDLHLFAAATTRVLAQRTGKTEDQVCATGWVAALTLTHLGRILVHAPPDLPMDEVFEALRRMLKGLLSEQGLSAAG